MVNRAERRLLRKENKKWLEEVRKRERELEEWRKQWRKKWRAMSKEEREKEREALKNFWRMIEKKSLEYK